jgi:hypothetical protein
VIYSRVFTSTVDRMFQDFFSLQTKFNIKRIVQCNKIGINSYLKKFVCGVCVDKSWRRSRLFLIRKREAGRGKYYPRMGLPTAKEEEPVAPVFNLWMAEMLLVLAAVWAGPITCLATQLVGPLVERAAINCTGSPDRTGKM